MKKMLFVAASAAIALASCSNDAELAQGTDPVVEDGAVMFSAYQARNTRTSDQTTGDGDAQNVTIKYLQDNGFGVFAYDQGTLPLVSYLASNTYPNFMYNQKVSTAAWTYDPLKYWPNNNGAMLTFQAYAPHNKDITPIFSAAYNGVGIRYAYDSANGYDLLWGATAETLASGDKPSYYDQKKPGVTDRTTFYFKHALAKLDFTVSYFSDKVHDASTPAAPGLAEGLLTLDPKTEIVIRSINLVGVLPTQGVLSLYDGSWTVEKTGTNIGYSTNDLNKVPTITNGAVTNRADLATGKEPGKLTNAVTALTSAGSMMVIPANTNLNTSATTKYQIEIVYDVITKDDKDDRNTSVVTNTINSGDIQSYPSAHEPAFEGISVEAGKYTTVNIHLGMTSAKFEAHVVDWETGESTDIDMPNNAAYTLLPAKSLAKAKLSADVAATDFSAVGEIVIDQNDKAYECTKAAASPAPAEYKQVAYPYILDAETTHANVYIYNGEVYVETTLKTGVTTLDEIDNTTPVGYYVIDDKLYYVDPNVAP